MATPNPQAITAEDLRPTTDSFMLAGYEFAVDREGTTADFEGELVRTLVVKGDAKVYEQMAGDSAFPFHYAGVAPTLYATGILSDGKGGAAEHISTADGDTDDGTVHGAYLDFGKEYPVDLALIHSEGWIIVEGTAVIEGKEYEIEVRLGVE